MLHLHDIKNKLGIRADFPAENNPRRPPSNKKTTRKKKRKIKAFSERRSCLFFCVGDEQQIAFTYQDGLLERDAGGIRFESQTFLHLDIIDPFIFLGKEKEGCHVSYIRDVVYISQTCRYYFRPKENITNKHVFFLMTKKKSSQMGVPRS